MKQRLKTKEKNKETKNSFFEKENKIDKPLAKTHQENKERTQSEKNQKRKPGKVTTQHHRNSEAHKTQLRNSAPVTGSELS